MQLSGPHSAAEAQMQPLFWYAVSKLGNVLLDTSAMDMLARQESRRHRHLLEASHLNMSIL